MIQLRIRQNIKVFQIILFLFTNIQKQWTFKIFIILKKILHTFIVQYKFHHKKMISYLLYKTFLIYKFIRIKRIQVQRKRNKFLILLKENNYLQLQS